MKKKIIIIIAVIIILIAGGFGYSVIADIKQEKKLNEELENINIIVDDMEKLDTQKVYEALERTVTKGDYGVVEKAYKDYVKGYFDNIVNILDVLNDEKLTQILSAENYKKDGPEFTNTKLYITETRTKLEAYKEIYSEFFTEEEAMSYINDKGLDSYYIDLYKNEIVGDIEKENEDKTVEKSIDEIIQLLDSSENIIDFLAANKKSWKIEGDEITFYKDSLADEYNALISEM